LIETQHSDKAWLDANRDRLTKLYALRRLGLPEDVAPTVVHLASPGAAWITGQVISVSGGFSMVG
jgi:3-oxoacyl-[acyl-carrier protein] reductase